MSVTSTKLTSYQLIQQYDTWVGQRGTDKTNTHALTECGVAVGELLGLNVFLQQMVCWKTGQGDCGRLAVSVWQTRTRREREREKTYKEKQKSKRGPKHQVNKQRKTITLTYRANTEEKRRKFAPSWERLINPETDFMTFTLRKTLQCEVEVA